MKSIRYRLQSWSGNRRNERNQKILDRGKLPRRDRAAAEIKSRTPIYRNRINRAHGNPHREDARLARTQDKSLARMKAARDAARTPSFRFGPGGYTHTAPARAPRQGRTR